MVPPPRGWTAGNKLAEFRPFHRYQAVKRTDCPLLFEGFAVAAANVSVKPPPASFFPSSRTNTLYPLQPNSLSCRLTLLPLLLTLLLRLWRQWQQVRTRKQSKRPLMLCASQSSLRRRILAPAASLSPPITLALGRV